jgi:hypothetical protein
MLYLQFVLSLKWSLCHAFSRVMVVLTAGMLMMASFPTGHVLASIGHVKRFNIGSVTLLEQYVINLQFKSVSRQQYDMLHDPSFPKADFPTFGRQHSSLPSCRQLLHSSNVYEIS